MIELGGNIDNLSTEIMPSRNDKTQRAYQFLVAAERDAKVFSLEELAAASGWKINTVKAYLTKKWHTLLRREADGFSCSGIGVMTEDAFVRLHAQRTDVSLDILRPRFTSAVDALIDKARESALLAVQVYNNPLVSFRAPGYIVHMVIAYTALFHAIFERRGTEYWHKEPDGSAKLIDGDTKAWELSECVHHYYGGQVSAEAENIRFFIQIRNKIEHRFMPALDTTLSGKCQALLMNFEALLVHEFGAFFAMGQNLALALQFSVFAKAQQEVLRRIQSREYEAIRRYIDAYDATLPPAVTDSMEYSFRAFLMPKVGNHLKSSDVAIEFVKYDPSNPEAMERLQKQVLLIREKQVPVADAGLMTAKRVVDEIARRTQQPFNMHHHTCAWKLYKVRPSKPKADGCKTEYCQYSAAFKQFAYTEAWVQFLCEKVLDPTEFERIRTYREAIAIAP